MEKEIRHVLTHWNYEKALQLYLSYGPKGYLAELFQQGESHYRSDKLQEELQGLLAHSQAVANPVSNSTAVAATTITDFYQLAEGLRNLILERNVTRKEKDRLFVLLPHEKTDIARKASAERILTLYHKEKELQRQIDYWYTHNKPMPEVPTPKIELDQVSLGRREAQIRSNIRSSRSRKQPEKVAYWEAQLAALHKEIGKIKQV
jgi:hypothetical protein